MLHGIYFSAKGTFLSVATIICFNCNDILPCPCSTLNPPWLIAVAATLGISPSHGLALASSGNVIAVATAAAAAGMVAVAVPGAAAASSF
jgi:hypothetical protein